MREDRIPRGLATLLRRFEPCFSGASFDNFVELVVGWMLCAGQRTISRVFAASGLLHRKHFSTAYRFLSRATWSPDDLFRVLTRLVVDRLGDEVEVLVDDTLLRRGGPHFFGTAMFHDAGASSYGGSSGPRKAFACGHNWVVLAIRLPLPWDNQRGIAIPVLARLYRSKKRCPEELYVKRTELAREMLMLLASWIPAGKRLLVAGDSEYACRTLVLDLPDEIEFTGPMHMGAALHGPVGKYRGKGRPRKQGQREPSPRARLGRCGGKWKLTRVELYGRAVQLQVKTSITRWTQVAGARPVRLVLTRDPAGKFKDRAYFTTDTQASVETVLQRIAHRWAIEVSFRNAKQLFGLGDAQNGWSKRSEKRSSAKRVRPSGPQPRGSRGELAVRRTAPIAWLVYALTVLHYLDVGRPGKEVELVRHFAPWYRHKRHPSVADMLARLRADLLARRLSPSPGNRAHWKKIINALPPSLLAA